MWQEIKNIYHLFIAILANIWYGFPSKKLIVIGVTGTDGKTTTVSLIYHILKESGRRVSMISTVGAIIGGETYDVGFHVTNPSSFPLQRFIKQAASVSDYLVLEVTSHGLDQNRVFGIDFAIAVLTNVSHEHLDYHKTREKYLAAKMKLLRHAKIAVINKDDEAHEKSSKLKVQSSKFKVVTFGIGEDSDVNIKNFQFKTKLIGEFNKYNVLAAVATCKALGVDDSSIRMAVSSFIPPIGRQDIIFDKDFKVIIDFAHTPNAFLQVLPEVKKITQKRLIHVFGAAGKRDVSKRPLMGEASARYADIIVLTAEDPRKEPVEKIMDEIAERIQNSPLRQGFAGQAKFPTSPRLRGASKIQNLYRIPDRKKAIEFAISIAKKGDVVLLTGKGHEKSMNYGHGEEPWDEYEAVDRALKMINRK